MTRNEQIIALHRAGNTQTAIAERFGLSQGRVSKITRKAFPDRAPGRPRVLPECHAERRLYRKVRDAIGVEAARREMGL